MKYQLYIKLHSDSKWVRWNDYDDLDQARSIAKAFIQLMNYHAAKVSESITLTEEIF